MLIEGTRKCEKCNHDFEWYCMPSMPFKHEELRAHFIPKEKASASWKTRDVNYNPDLISVRCIRYECDHQNTFKINYKDVKVS